MPPSTKSRRRSNGKRKRSANSDNDVASDAAIAAAVAASPAPAPAPATTKAPAVIYIDDESDEIALEALSHVAVLADVSDDAGASDEFWIAQLLDDVTHAMLEAGDVAVRITWLNRVGADTAASVTDSAAAPASDKDGDDDGGDNDGDDDDDGNDDGKDDGDDDEEAAVSKPSKKTNAKPTSTASRYTYAYDDAIDVDAILCHVFGLECADGSLEITPASLQRIQRRLARAKAALANPDALNDGGDDNDASDNEKPPSAARQRRQLAAKAERSSDGPGRTKRARTSSGGSRRKVASAGGAPKLSKRDAARIIPPRYATVDIALHDDRESTGTHAFAPILNDVLAANREVIRAVLTQDYALLEHVTETPDVHKHMSTLSANRSVDIRRTALQYAIEADDVKAVAQLLKAREAIKNSKFATAPSSALPSHSTGAHTSSYSDYNRRAINASRGGKEGNNALLADTDLGHGIDLSVEKGIFWRHPRASLKMLTLFYPSGAWASQYDVPHLVARVARAGNLPLLTKMVETLVRNGGWGFNDLHLRVLSSSDDALPVFRAVSVTKMTQQTKIQPLHFAALNPNSKYLSQLWETLEEKPEHSKDDAGFEPLHYAATCATSDNIRYLLENDRSLLAKTKQEKLTPLMCAIRTQREDNAIVMLDMAAAKSQELLTQVVNARGAQSYQAIHYAAKHGCVRVIERLLHHGVAVNALAGDKTSALCVAAQFGQFDAATTLLARGAKVNLGDKLDKTPLIFAVKNGHTRLAALLINHGANVNAYDTSENSVAHYAASYGWLSCVELLAAAGAEFWSRNAWGYVPLICAMLKQRTLCADYILENDTTGRFLDFRDREGCTMLFLQCQYSSSLAQIEYLVKKGLNPNIPNANGTYPLDVLIERAARNNETFSVDAIKLLLAHGARAQYDPPADPDAPAARQPLHNAIRRQLPAIAELLLTDGRADPAVEEADGADAWLRAANLGDNGEPFFRLLLAHHNAAHGDASPIPFSSRQCGKSFFHVVAEYYYFEQPSEMVAVDLVRECIARCPTVNDMMNTKVNGSSPLMTLVGNERREYDVTECSLDVLKRVDTMYTDVLRLYAAHTTDPEALVMYTTVPNPKYKEPEDETATPAAASDDVDMDAAAATAAEPKTFTYKCKNILHVASGRNLFTTARRAAQRWYGEDILSVLLEVFAFAADELNFAATSSWDTPLTLAVKKQFTLGAKLLLEHGAKPDHSPQRCDVCSTIDKPVSVSHCGQHSSLVGTALMDAINNKDVETAKLLLASGASPACTNGLEQLTPLHIVMSNGDVEMAKCLLEHGADPATTSRAENTALLWAIKGGRSIPVKKPHEGEVSYSRNTTALTVASTRSSASSASAASIIEVALTYASVRATLRIGDEHGRTALYYAARNRDVPLLRALVSAHPDKQTCANACDAFGRTPLHAAVNAVSMNADATFDVERYLLLAGADVNAVDVFGFSALHFALFKVDLNWHATYDSRLGRDAVAEQKRLRTYDSTKDAASRAYFGKIPSRESDPVETVSNLVAARGVNLLSLDLLERTPIHLAAATGAFVCVSTLLSNLPSAASRQRVLEMKDASELTPLACAFLHLRQTTITTLIQSNASVADKLRLSSSSSKARSFFYHAVKHSLAGIYHLLLNAKFSRRQAVEDAVLCGEFQLASNLIIGLEISNDSHSLGACNASESETLLHCLARVDKPFDDLPRAIAWTLLENGVDVHHVNRKGNSALHFAARNGNAHLMDFLLHHGCDINARNAAGETPLLYALRKARSRVDMCMGLIAYCLDVPSFDLHARDRSGRNVLLVVLDQFIAEFTRTDTALFKTMATLLTRGAKPDLVFESGKHVWHDVFGDEAADATDAVAAPATSKTTTALVLITYVAPVIMRYELLELFLSHNAKLTVRDSTGNAVLMHLVAKNLKPELKLALGVTCTAKNARAQASEIKAAVAQQNSRGQTPLHVAVQALAYGALENHDVVEQLVKSGARFSARNHQRETVVDCIKRQQSRALFRFVRATFPDAIGADVSEAAFFGDDSDDDAMPDAPPAYEADAAEYIAQCEAAGKFERTPVTPEVDDNCDVGSVSRVYCAVDPATNEPIATEFFHVLLTKVDVKNGRFGVNAFYRMQVVVDELQEIYILFTNWGRIGEDGKYQNTPFRTAADAVVEFKKIFRSKTGNVWDTRRTAFEKKPGKYNLVQRVDVHTEIAPDVTEPFHARVKSADGVEPAAFAPLATPQQPLPLTQMLYAITDIRHLQLAAAESCSYNEALPLAKRDELEAAIAKLREILDVLEQRAVVDTAIQALAGDVSDEGTAKLEALSTQYGDLTEVISEKSSRYYEVMPCNEAELDSSIEAFESPAQVHKELARLQRLVEITQTYKILLGAKLRQQAVHPLDYCRAALQVQFAPLSDSDGSAACEKALLTTYFFRGIRESDHKKYKVANIFRVERHGERARLEDLLACEPALARQPTQLLWHGTRRTNLMGILAQGLRIAPPEAPHHGYSYGKGLYFADVAQKSLGYCDGAYVIEDTRVDAESGKDVTTRRRVQYMLLCQVALGETELADAVRGKTAQFMDCSSVASVKAPGAHAPDRSKSVVSPDCDAIVPVGPVGKPGVAYPIDVAWAVEKHTYRGVRTTLDASGIAYLEELVAKHASVEETESDSSTGAVIEISDNEKYHVLDHWNASNAKLTIQVLKRPRAGAGAAERGFDIALQCKVKIESWRNVEHHTFHVRRYRNVLYETLEVNGYHAADKSEQSHWSSHHSYNELIVYKEAQARIRYLVEVEFQ